MNAPLPFTLRGIDFTHPYLVQRGISEETARYFGVGFYRGMGSMNGRVVIPIHDAAGRLVAYAGRSIDGRKPKYLLPRGFSKNRELFNLHRVNGSEVIVVEGYFDSMTVWQAVRQPVVALMGSSLSEHQKQVLLQRFHRVTLLLDGDDPGRCATENISRELVRHIFVRVVELGEGQQPDSLQPEELEMLLSPRDRE
jgi:DNA primase